MTALNTIAWSLGKRGGQTKCFECSNTTTRYFPVLNKEKEQPICEKCIQSYNEWLQKMGEEVLTVRALFCRCFPDIPLQTSSDPTAVKFEPCPSDP